MSAGKIFEHGWHAHDLPLQRAPCLVLPASLTLREAGIVLQAPEVAATQLASIRKFASHDSDVFDCLMEVSCVAATSGACKTMP